MGAAAQRPKLRARRGDIGGLVEPVAVADQDLIGADHQRLRLAPRDLRRLQSGQQQRSLLDALRPRPGSTLDRSLIDVAPAGFEPKPPQPAASTAGCRGAGQDQPGRRTAAASSPGFSALRRRSCQASMSCSTVAAVSSIERRVTSITGQPRRLHSRLAQSSSALTASSSTYSVLFWRTIPAALPESRSGEAGDGGSRSAPRRPVSGR